MTRRLVGACIAAAFALGFVSGAAGTIVAHEDTPRRDHAVTMAEHMAGHDMDTMMSASMSSMMSGPMLGPGASFGPGMMSDPASSSMSGRQHALHHPAAAQDVVR